MNPMLALLGIEVEAIAIVAIGLSRLGGQYQGQKG